MALFSRTRNSPINPVQGGGGATGSSGAILVSGSGVRAIPPGPGQLPGGTGKLSKAINRGAYLVIIPASGYVNFPAAIVPNDATVRIRAHNGTNAGNTGPIGLCDSFEQARGVSAPADFVNPDDEVIYPIDNLARIWVRGNPGDGAIASIRSGGVDQ